jgi:hypothetical protein
VTASAISPSQDLVLKFFLAKFGSQVRIVCDVVSKFSTFNFKADNILNQTFSKSHNVAMWII